jgi:hypothetical protein
VAVRPVAWLNLFVVFAGCRIMSSGLAGQGLAGPEPDAAAEPEAPPALDGPPPAIDVGEPPGVLGLPLAVGCSDGSREGFRDVAHWPNIAGCAGGFDQAGVLGATTLSPMCYLQAGDTSGNPYGVGCSAADLCALQWHVCRGPSDVAAHSPTGDCESCVLAGEPRFFLVAAGASPMGICTPDPEATNDLHGCGGFGEPESDACAPLVRRLGFADCLASHGVWSCGGEADSLREAAIVTKPGVGMGGVLCCKD